MEEAVAVAVAVAEAGPKMRRSSPVGMSSLVRKSSPVRKGSPVRKTVVAMVEAVEDLDMCCTPRCP